ncbi:MAG: class I SAM-dependent methyltransferase [Nitrospirae bacterium]|nr:class I SAM-dependent methyltransferase [Nitrospirota bacterium]MBI5694219.1 class I SAM-dependent methyltransferase [Nitrospirota bacterium]
MPDSPDKKASTDFWNRNPCGGSWSSLEEQKNWRYRKEPWIIDIIARLPIEGKTVLEVGCGPGLDTVQLASRAGRVVGVDLSTNSLAAARCNVERSGAGNVSLVMGDAECLPVKDGSVDVVFSYGVLHHTPDIGRAVKDIHRALRKGGTGAVMLYRSRTIQSAIVSVVRAAKKITDLLRLSRPGGGAALDVNPAEGTSVKELLYCPVLDRYSRGEARRLFGAFTDVRMECYQTGFSRLAGFLPLGNGKAGEMTAGFLWGLERLTQGLMGYYMVVYFKKPS